MIIAPLEINKMFSLSPGRFASRTAMFLKAKGSGGVLRDDSPYDHIVRMGSVGNARIMYSRSLGTSLRLPGASGQYARTLDNAALDITGDIDLRAYVLPDTWTPSETKHFITKRIGSPSNSYMFGMTSTGALILAWGNGVTEPNILSTVVVPSVAGVPIWVRATLDVDNGAGGYTVRFYTSSDGVIWTQLGADITAAGVQSIVSGSANLEIGSRSSGTASLFAGHLFHVQIRNGIDGTLVYDADFRKQTVNAASFVEASASALTVTILNPSSADTNDPQWLPHAGVNYAYFPGSAGNSLTVPNPGAVAVNYTITYEDLTTATNTSSANPLTFGGTDVQFAGKSVRSIVFTSGLTGQFLASAVVEPHLTHIDSSGNIWTFNRSATGRKTHLVTEDCFLLGADDFIEVINSPGLNFKLTDSWTAIILFRHFGSAGEQALMAMGTTPGWRLRLNSASGPVAGQLQEGSNLPTATATRPNSNGARSFVALARRVTQDNIQVFSEGAFGAPVTDTTTVAISNPDGLRIGRLGGAGTNYADIVFLGAVLVRQELALSSQEVATIIQELTS